MGVSVHQCIRRERERCEGSSQILPHVSYPDSCSRSSRVIVDDCRAEHPRPEVREHSLRASLHQERERVNILSHSSLKTLTPRERERHGLSSVRKRGGPLHPDRKQEIDPSLTLCVRLVREREEFWRRNTDRHTRDTCLSTRHAAAVLCCCLTPVTRNGIYGFSLTLRS